jgi:hypothetical protein
MRWDYLVHGDHSQAVGLGRAMLVSMTMGGLAMLGWRLLQMRREGFGRRAMARAPVERGRTIYRNTPEATDLSNM